MLRMETVVDCVYDGLYIVNAARQIVFWSRGAQRITGYSKDDVQGRTCGLTLLSHVNEEGCRLCQGACPLVATLVDGLTREARLFLRHRQGHRVAVDVHVERMLDDRGQPFGVETFSDRRSKQATQSTTTRHDTGRTDPLTGLPTGLTMRFELHTLLAESRVFGLPIGGLLVELTGLDEVRRLYGSAVMDQWVHSAARTLADALPDASLSRWREDSFIALDHSVKSAWELAMQADRIRQLLQASGVAGPQPISGLSIEIATATSLPRDTVDTFLDRLKKLLLNGTDTEPRLIDGEIVEPPPRNPDDTPPTGDIVAPE